MDIDAQVRSTAKALEVALEKANSFLDEHGGGVHVADVEEWLDQTQGALMDADTKVIAGGAKTKYLEQWTKRWDDSLLQLVGRPLEEMKKLNDEWEEMLRGPLAKAVSDVQKVLLKQAVMRFAADKAAENRTRQDKAVKALWWIGGAGLVVSLVVGSVFSAFASRMVWLEWLTEYVGLGPALGAGGVVAFGMTVAWLVLKKASDLADHYDAVGLKVELLTRHREEKERHGEAPAVPAEEYLKLLDVSEFRIAANRLDKTGLPPG